jgi:TolB protein
MIPSRKILIGVLGILVLCFCIVGIGGILWIAWYSTNSKPAPPPLIFPTRNPAVVIPTHPAGLVTSTPEAEFSPKGKIVFVCQIFRTQAQDQLCIINADGTGWRRLTTSDNVRSFYPSLAPDGNSVLFSSNMNGNFKLFELSLAGQLTQLGDTVGIAPELSPDNTQIVFTNNDGHKDMIWIMDRDGGHPRLLYVDAWDPTWSPDGKRVLFAINIDGIPQLATINQDGTDFQQITNMAFLRGRSDWSSNGKNIVTYEGKPWERELYLLNFDGTDPHQITPSGGNSQGPSFSPDGEWVAFTAYFGAIGNNNGCEIYIMRINGSNLKRLTDNNYCDWQPRWGP